MGLLSGSQRMGAAALLLAASTILSRLMGLVRDKIISWQFGAGSEADMYFAAFMVPDIINSLLAGGIMSITMLPLLSRRFAEDEADAWRFFSCVFCWMLLASLLATGAGILCAGPLARLTAPGFDAAQIARLAFFMRIILPAQVFFLCGFECDCRPCHCVSGSHSSGRHSRDSLPVGYSLAGNRCRPVP